MKAVPAWLLLALGLGLVSSCNGDPNRIELFEFEDEQPQVECEADLVCATPTPYCYGNLCVACLTNTNCGNRFCEPSSHTCVECVTSGDCKSDKPYCFSNQCRQCLIAENCGDPLLACDTRDGKCVPSCAADDGCSGPSPVCLPDLSICVECAVDEDCPDDRYCERNKCVDCRSNEDCDMARPQCDPDKLECVECLVDDDCGAERACDMKKCL